MRGLAVTVIVAILMAGCFGSVPKEETGPEPVDDVPRTARGRPGEGEGGNRTTAVIGAASGGVTQAGTYPFTLEVPQGGATKVDWVLEVVPLAAFTLDGVEGPGCETTGWHSGITSSGTTGNCGTVQPGVHEWSFTLNAPVASYQVEVRGQVWEEPRTPSNATER